MDANFSPINGIRPAGPADYLVLARLGEQAYREHFTYLWEPDQLNRYLAFAYAPEFFKTVLESQNVRIWLAGSGQEVAGYLMYYRRKSLPGFTDEGGYVNRIYLLDRCLGQGYGSRLMNCALQQAQSDKRAYVWLESMQSSEQSIHFYRKHGFQIHGETAYTNPKVKMRTPELAKMYFMTRLVL